MDVILINRFKFHPLEHRVYCGKEKIDLQPKCAEVLKYLADRQGQVISKKTLLETIWQDQVVEDGALASAIKKIRKQLGDDAKSPQLIETINKKGYRMIAKVQIAKPILWYNKIPLNKLPSLFLSVIFSLVIIFFMTHSDISIYQFSDSDTLEERSNKIRSLTNNINNGDGNGRFLKITIES